MNVTELNADLTSCICVEGDWMQPQLSAMRNANLELQVGRWITGSKAVIAACCLESTLLLSRPPGAAV